MKAFRISFNPLIVPARIYKILCRPLSKFLLCTNSDINFFFIDISLFEIIVYKTV